MNDQILRIYDKPMCCSTGVCGAEVDPVLSRFAADLEHLRRRGIAVERYNPAQEPEAFASNAAVRRALQERGPACLPLVLWGEITVTSGRYPDRDILEQTTGRDAPAMGGGA